MRHSLPTEQPRRRNERTDSVRSRRGPRDGFAASSARTLRRTAPLEARRGSRLRFASRRTPGCARPRRAATTRSEHDRQRKDSPPHRQVSSRTTSTRARCPTEPTASLSWSATRLATRIHRHAHVHRHQWLARWRHRRGAAAFTTRRIRDVDRAALAGQRESGRSSDFSSGSRCQGRRSW
jgi:hypothetical protein